MFLFGLRVDSKHRGKGLAHLLMVRTVLQAVPRSSAAKLVCHQLVGGMCDVPADISLITLAAGRHHCLQQGHVPASKSSPVGE